MQVKGGLWFCTIFDLGVDFDILVTMVPFANSMVSNKF